MGELALLHQGRHERALAGRVLSDERLARLVARGNTTAFALIYRRHHQALFRYARSIVRMDADAQDVLQSAMVRALQALRSQERDIAVRPWLFRIVHNEAISALRARRSHVPLEEAAEPVRDSERALEDRERLAALVADLQSLPERQRATLVMRELNGLSIEELALVHGVSLGAVRQTLFEARAALHELEEGRAMDCELVRRTISDGDRRSLRARRIRAHLRDCGGCREFESQISARRAALHSLAPPLAPVAAGALLGRVLVHAGAPAGGAAAASGAALGKAGGAPLVAKILAGAALAGATAAGAAHVVLTPSARPSHVRAHNAPVSRSGAPPAVGTARTRSRAATPTVSGATHSHSRRPHGAHGSGSLLSTLPRTGSLSVPAGVLAPGKVHGRARHGATGRHAAAHRGAGARNGRGATHLSARHGLGGGPASSQASSREAREMGAGVHEPSVRLRSTPVRPVAPGESEASPAASRRGGAPDSTE